MERVESLRGGMGGRWRVGEVKKVEKYGGKVEVDRWRFGMAGWGKVERWLGRGGEVERWAGAGGGQAPPFICKDYGAIELLRKW